jgi:hypothetical protein
MHGTHEDASFMTRVIPEVNREVSRGRKSVRRK